MDVIYRHHPDVVVPFDEHQRLLHELSRTFDLHVLLRKLEPLVFGVELPADEVEHLRQDYQHFVRDFSPLLDGST